MIPALMHSRRKSGKAIPVREGLADPAAAYQSGNV